MTSYIANVASGRDVALTRIDRVEPSSISLCQEAEGDAIEVLVYGSNVWRSTELYLAGVAAPEEFVRVLPDMEGVRARFPLAQVRRAAQDDSVKLLAWTRNGFDERTLPLVADRDCAPVGRTEVASGRPQILAVYPSVISACDKSVTLVAETRGLGDPTADKEALFGNAPANAKPVAGASGFFKVNIDDTTGKNTGLAKLHLTLVGTGGAARFPLVRKGAPAGGCPAAAAEEQQKPAIATVAPATGEEAIFVCVANDLTLNATGNGLKGAETVQFGHLGGRPFNVKDDSLSVTVKRSELAALPVDTMPFRVLGKGSALIAEKDVQVKCKPA